MSKWGYISAAMQGLSALFLLASSAWLISRAAEHPPVMYLTIAVVGVRAFALGRASFRYSERIILHNEAFAQSSKTRPKIFEALIPFAPAKLSSLSRGSFISSVVSDVDELQNRIVRFWGPVAQTIAVIVAGSAVSFWLVPETGVALLIFVGLAIVVVLPLTAKFSAAQSQSISHQRAELAALNISSFESYAMLAAFGWLDQRLERANKLTEQINRSESRISMSSAWASGAVNLLAGFSILAATWLASMAYDSDRLSGVAIAVVAMIPMAIFEVIQANSAIFGVRIRYRASQKRIDNLIERSLPESIRVGEGFVELSSIRNLELQKITIEYDESIGVISNFDLKLTAGQTLALTGPSGSGKTSLAYALLRFLEPASGDYLINSRPASEYSAESIRRRIGYIEQNPTIFLGNVRENLALANPAASDKDLWAVLEAVNLRDAFESRDGLSTQLGERGSLISSGEAQRVAIARALLANFELLILDEPTANLDSTNASALLNDVFALAKNLKRSLVLITHDEEVAQRCDSVIELSQQAIEGAW